MKHTCDIDIWHINGAIGKFWFKLASGEKDISISIWKDKSQNVIIYLSKLTNNGGSADFDFAQLKFKLNSGYRLINVKRQIKVK